MSESQADNIILGFDNVSISFGAVTALTQVSFEVPEHEVVAIIGPNGAGKTTALNVINGVYQPTQGTITYKGEVRQGMRPHEAAVQGIARTFQNVALFKGMNTVDNIMTGRNLKMKSNLLMQGLYWGPAQREEIAHRQAVEKIIDFLEIESVRKTIVGRLPFGLHKLGVTGSCQQRSLHLLGSHEQMSSFPYFAALPDTRQHLLAAFLPK